MRAPVIIITIVLKTRWFRSLAFFSLFFLAIREIGASQQLNTIRGAEIESEASTWDSLCHVADQCFEKTIREKRANRALCEIELAHSLFLGITRVVTIMPVVNNIRVIIALKIC